ncbi:glycosyltransferase [Acidimicrobiaceae bacterium USS-CC1]|uniref:Glycosyltransferase n=1 Tax=Acidiferrimicrobium australe TaxID=2664430 RepID=A0ABW9QQ11_9ACTN|nr:glycosyltransferase [Acidiferrimicrobium australe]
MRILILSWRDLRHPHAGGSEVYTQNLARHWTAGGHQVTFFCSEAPGAAADETHDGYQIVRRGKRLSVYREARRWYREHGRGRFDVVLDVINTRPFLAVRWVDDAPVVALAHQVCREVWRYEMPLPLALVGRYWLEPRWLAAYRDTLTITVSESSRESLEDYGLTRLEVVPEGVDGDLSTRGRVAKEPVPTLIWVGRLSANKRPGHAVEAFRLLRRRVPDARLWMVGDGPLRASLERDAPDGVGFFGRVDQDTKQDLMARAHLLVATSVREGWGLIVSEAALVGTPTVAYDVAGLRDSVTAAGGWLCPPDPTALAERLPAALARLRRAPGGGTGTVSWSEVADGVLAQLLSGISPILPS